ncbi:MAG TPA: serine/threonine-protein kinase [Steroidobacteraceae bacterium]
MPISQPTLQRGADTVAGARPESLRQAHSHHPDVRGAFERGYRVRGRYVLEESIGRGAMGEVWRAKDLLGVEAQDRNPYVALKVLNSDFAGQPEAFVALHREATRAQQLAHPNIATVYQFDRDDTSGHAFIVMELLEGAPLDRLIDESRGALPHERLLRIVVGMAEGLDYAHRRGIVHADFKPGNVFVTRNDTAKILDFGIARAVQISGVGPPVDEDGFQGYTETYASPAVLRDEPPTRADDVFALGIVAYEIVTGEHPFGRRPALAVLGEKVGRFPLRGLTRRESNAIGKALLFDAGQRFPDAGAFVNALRGTPRLQNALLVAVAMLAVAVGGLSYFNWTSSLPSEPITALPLEIQQKFREQIRLGNESLAYHERTQDLHGSDDAADYFANAYRLHERDPLAVAGLEVAANDEIAFYRSLADRQVARRSLENLRAKSEYYQSYAPLGRAIRALGGE